MDDVLWIGGIKMGLIKKFKKWYWKNRRCNTCEFVWNGKECPLKPGTGFLEAMHCSKYKRGK